MDLDYSLVNKLLNAYFYGICKNYFRQQQIVYCWVRDKLRPVITHKSIEYSDKEDNEPNSIENDRKMDVDEYPVSLSRDINS